MLLLTLCLLLSNSFFANGAPIHEPLITKDGAFQQYAHAELNCATPIFHAQTNGLDSCTEECIKRPECLSLNWYPYQHNCDLFSVVGKLSFNEAGKPASCANGPDVCESIGAAYLVKIGAGSGGAYVTTTTVSSGGAYVTSTVPPTYGPGTTLPPTYGPATSLPPTYGPSTTAALSTYGQTDLTPLTPATSIPTVTQSFQLTTPLTLPTEPNTNTPATLPTELPTSQSTLAQDETSPTVAPPEGTNCAADETVKFLKISGLQMVGANDASFVAASEQQCLDACQANQLPSGETAFCRSVNFNTQSSTCSINVNALAPTGSGSSSDSPTAVYYEKICLKNGDVAGCGTTFPLEHQHILTGYARAVVTATSAKQCVEECVKANLNFGFSCQSGMYYDSTSAPTDNCILNSESKTTKPELYIPASIATEKVDYFESSCQADPSLTTISPNDNGGVVVQGTKKGSILEQSNPQWSTWSNCDKRTSTRKRYQNCASMAPKSCQNHATEPCTPTVKDILKPTMVPTPKFIAKLTRLTTRKH